MSEKLFDGVGLLKLESSCSVEEFYIVVFRGRVVGHKFESYQDAKAYYAKLVELGAQKPGEHAKTLLGRIEADPKLIVRTHLGRLAAPVSV